MKSSRRSGLLYRGHTLLTEPKYVEDFIMMPSDLLRSISPSQPAGHAKTAALVAGFLLVCCLFGDSSLVSKHLLVSDINPIGAIKEARSLQGCHVGLFLE
jgi:hypothetical protein